MSESDASLAISEQVGAAVEHAISDGRRIVDTAFYNRSADALVLFCFPFAIVIGRSLVPELQNIAQDAMETLSISPSGSTLVIESQNIYIETAGLVMAFIASIRAKKVNGGLLFDLLQRA